MILVDHDDRLVALNDDATEAVVWSPDEKAWRETGEDFARKAWLEGVELTGAEAASRFPGADLENVPVG
jgi:hypothetical protein